MELDVDQPSDRYSLRAFRLIGVAGLLVGALLGVLFGTNVLRGDRNSAASSPTVTRSTTSSSAPAAAASGGPASPAPACRDNVVQFLHTVRTRVDPDGDELRGVSDSALVVLGHAALKQPAVLETTKLVPFQRPRFIGAANQWLCRS